MSVKISERTVAQWFIDLEPGVVDFLGGLSLDDDDKYTFTYRFRYHSAQKSGPWEGKDRKSWYSIQSKKGQTREEALAGIQLVIDKLEAASGRKADRILMKDGNVKAFIDELSKRDYAHVKHAALTSDGRFVDEDGREFDEKTGSMKSGPVENISKNN